MYSACSKRGFCPSTFKPDKIKLLASQKGGGRPVKDVEAPTAPLYAYPACCPSRINLKGDVMNSLVNDKLLNYIFYAINSGVTPRNAPDSPLSARIES